MSPILCQITKNRPLKSLDLNPSSLKQLQWTRFIWICLLLSEGLLGCGGAPSPQVASPSSRPRTVRDQMQQEETFTPKKPVVKRAAKDLFIQAGKAATNQQYDDAIDLYKEAYAEDNNLHLAVYNIGYVYQLKGDETNAIEWYQKASRVGISEGWVNIGLMQLAKKEEVSAKLSFEKALSMDPLNGRAHLNLALLAKNSRNFRQAMSSVREALKEDSANVDAYNVLAQIYYDWDKLKLAALVCDAGLNELDSNHPGLLTTQGLIYLKMDDVIRAVRSFRKAVNQDSTNLAARLNLGAITYNYRDYEQAYQLFSEASVIDPQNIEAILSKAVAARALKRFEEAKAGYEQVLTLAPKHPGATFNLAVLNHIFSHGKSFDGRLEAIQTAIRQYQQVLEFSADKNFRKKVVDQIEEAKLELEAVMIEKTAEEEAKKAEAEAAAASQANPSDASPAK